MDPSGSVIGFSIQLLIPGIVIYPLDNVIQLLNNWELMRIRSLLTHDCHIVVTSGVTEFD